MNPTPVLVREIPLGPDCRLRVAALAKPRETLLELRIWRASPADRSEDRFHPTSEGVQIPLAVFKLLQAELTRVGQAAMEHEFWRPLAGADAIPTSRPPEAA